MEATHISIASDERTVIAPGPELVLAGVRAVVRVAGSHLSLFCVVDDHAHAVVGLERDAAGTVGRGLAYALGAVSPVELAPARFKRVDGRSHLTWLVGYVLRQPSKHRLQHVGHPALWPGSCFVDLVGARLLAGFDPRLLATALPRLGRHDVYEAVGMTPVSPLGDDETRAEGPRRIGDAAAAAVGVATLEGRDADVVRARRGAGRLLRALGFTDEQAAFGLRCPRSTASRLTRTALPDPPLERAIRLQLALRRAAAVAEILPFQGESEFVPLKRGRAI